MGAESSTGCVIKLLLVPPHKITLCVAARGTTARRLPVLSTVDPSEWREFRRQFNFCIFDSMWTQGRRKRALASCMIGEAGRAIADIPLGPDVGNDAVTLQNLLDRYEARFLPAANARNARLQFHNTHQRPDEGVMAYHNRKREEFTRAYPNVADVETNGLLIDTFIDGLYDAEVAKLVATSDPQAYTNALSSAQRIAASMQYWHGGSGGNGARRIVPNPGSTNGGVHFMSRGRGNTGGGYRGRGSRGSWPSNGATASGRSSRGASRRGGSHSGWQRSRSPLRRNRDRNGRSGCWHCGRSGHNQQYCPDNPESAVWTPQRRTVNALGRDEDSETRQWIEVNEDEESENY